MTTAVSATAWPVRDASVENPGAAEPLPQAPIDPFASPKDPSAGGLLRRVLQDRDALLDEIVDGKKIGLGKVALVSLVLTALGGLGLGVSTGPLQAVSAAVKMPLVGLGALLICFPAFFIAGVLQGSKISLDRALRLFAVGLGLKGAIVAALAPILIFVASVGSPYAFILLGGLFVFGMAELGFLRTIDLGITKLRARHADAFGATLVRVWMAIYLAVAAQLTWSMRPFIQQPGSGDFCLFEGPGGNMVAFCLERIFQGLR